VPGAFRLLTRRAGPVGILLTLFDVYRRLPPAQRRRLVETTRKHGPRLADQALRRVSAARRRS
jgi:hypothetical protein